MKVHPAAEAFPMLARDALAELANSIRTNGLREPIVTHDGLLVDGRNRLAACTLAGVEPTFIDYDGDLDDLVNWIVDKNVHRRHLTTSQRAMVAARLATLPDGHRPVGNFADVPTQAEASKGLTVSERSTRAARRVLESGDDRLIEKVDDGEITVSAAVKQLQRRPGGRAPLDAYWTPDHVAIACLRWLEATGVVTATGHVLEPAVGGGAWVRAVRKVWRNANVQALDLDPAAPGLDEADSGTVYDFFDLPTERVADVIVGNPPYDSDRLIEWVERSLEMADVVAYLLRETITGTTGRLPWWRAHRPRLIAKLCPRPKWEGPGAYETVDRADSVFVVWARHTTFTDWDWIDTTTHRGDAQCLP